MSILRIRFKGADIDFVKAISFEAREPISSVMVKIDQVRRAAGTRVGWLCTSLNVSLVCTCIVPGWSEDKPMSQFGCIRIPSPLYGGGEAFWFDATSSAPLSSLQLRERELIEYRELARPLRIVRRDGAGAAAKVIVNESQVGGADVTMALV
jgi:hypothetical protein